MTEPELSPIPARREPPPFRVVTVADTERVSNRLQRITFTGPELDGFTVTEPASSVRVLLPSAGKTELVLPAWHGNEFLLPDGARAAIRTLTPSLCDAASAYLTVDVVVHDEGLLSDWAHAVAPGAAAAVSGPGRGYTVDPAARSFVLAGDESALPALIQVLDAVPPNTPAHVVIEVVDSAAVGRVPTRPGTTIEPRIVSSDATPGIALGAALTDVPVDAGTRVWVAGEAAAVQRVRQHFFVERGVARNQCTIRGYWKAGRDGVDGT